MHQPHKLELSYDQVLEQLPPIGNWQVLTVFLTCLSASIGGFIMVWPSFMRVEVPYECSDWIEGKDRSASVAPSPCSSECVDWKFNYSGSDVSTSLQESFKLVCDKEDILKYHGTIFFLGLFVGSLLSGFMSDRIGRVKWLRICVFTINVNIFLIGLTNSLILHLISWFLINVQLMGTWITAFTYYSEIVPIKYRDIPGMIDSLFCGMTISLCSLLAYFITDWKYLSLTLGAITSVAFLITCVLHESPRWLWSMGRFEEAIKTLKFAASLQCQVIDADFTKTLEEVTRKGVKHLNFAQTLKRDFKSLLGSTSSLERKYSVIDLFRHRVLASQIILLSYLWIVANILFYGVLFGAHLFKQQIHVYSAIQGAATSMGSVCGILILRVLGRKVVVVVCFFLAGCCFLLAIFTPTDFRVINLILACVNKLTMQIAFMTCYLWTAELNPTVLRSNAIGFASMTSRVVGLTIPFIDNFSRIWEHLPLLIYSLLSFSVIFCSALLPETRGKKLLETIEDGERSLGSDNLEIQEMLKHKSGVET